MNHDEKQDHGRPGRRDKRVPGRKYPTRSYATTPWAEEALDYLMEATTYPSKAAMLPPAVLALVAATVSSLERDGQDGDAELITKGRELLRRFTSQDPAMRAALNG